MGQQGQYYQTEGLMTGNDITYIQQCSNVCSNHPTCTAFTFEANSEHGSQVMRNTNDCWGNVATSSGGNGANTCSGTKWMRGTCRLYSECRPEEYEDVTPSGGRGLKTWHLGNNNNDGFCINPKGGNGAIFDVNLGPTACDDGLELKDRKCSPCDVGSFKVGFNNNQCETCRTCPTGQYQKQACGTTADTACFSHADTCANTEYQSVAPSATQDRQCASCKSCSAGSMIGFGCDRHDPWTTTQWTSDATGKATGALSVYQSANIANRVLVLHVGAEKAACGPVVPFYGACPSRDTWATQTWTSNAHGVAHFSAVTACSSESLKERVVVIHDSDTNKVGCGQLKETTPGIFTATITTIDGASTFRDISGEFTLNHSGEGAVTGEFSLSGLEHSKMGMWHVHEGNTCSNPGGHLLNPQYGYTAALTGINGHSITGDYHLKQTEEQLIGNYQFEGLPANSMGMYHMHAGSSCSAPGAHLGNTQATTHTHDDAFSNQRRLLEAGHPLPSGLVSTGNTICVPCVPGISFSTSADSAACQALQVCAVGTYETKAGTATSDRECGACTNAPAKADYTSNGGDASNCKFQCKSGFTASNDGKECESGRGSSITFSGGNLKSKMIKLENDVLTFNNFKCVEAPEFCGGMNLETMASELTQAKAEIKAVQTWAKSINAWAKGMGYTA
jgi:hypothetical protein